jgi:hypothetical protein
VRQHAVACAAPAERVWELLARPDRWREWSPYVIGAEGLGSPEVIEGSHGRLITRGGLRIGARITAVTPGESWSWQVGGLLIHHSVRPDRNGSVIEHGIEGTAARWSVVARAYAPIVGQIARHLARVAERGGSHADDWND